MLAFESADHPVEAWMARALELIQDHGGRRAAGRERGRARPGAPPSSACPTPARSRCRLGVITDTFETAMTWDRFEALHAAGARGDRGSDPGGDRPAGTGHLPVHPRLPRRPGALLHLQRPRPPGRLLEQWRHVKRRASDALLAAGGTITHHHAVGRDHMPWYLQQRPALFGAALAAAKATLDPAGILNPGVLVGRGPDDRRA